MHQTDWTIERLVVIHRAGVFTQLLEPINAKYTEYPFSGISKRKTGIKEVISCGKRS